MIHTIIISQVCVRTLQRGIVHIRPPLAGRAPVDRYVLLAGRTAANLQQRVCWCVPMLGQTDRRTYGRTDTVHTMRAVPTVIVNTFV